MTVVAKYSELGLVDTKGMFMEAMKGRYAVPAYNFNNMEQLQAILMGCSESRSPVILQCSGSAIKYMNSTLLRRMVKGAMAMPVKWSILEGGMVQGLETEGIDGEILQGSGRTLP